MLTAIVMAWSTFTMATGAAQGLVSLILIQFCFGAAESGAWPAITRTLSRWIPYRERGTAQGIVWIGAHITVGLTPMLVHELNATSMLVAVDLLPLRPYRPVWAAVWYWWFRDEPSQHRQVNAAELAHIMAGRKAAAGEDRAPVAGVFWRRLLTHRNVLALCLMYLPNSFIFYFCITWFPKYLSEGRGMEGRALAFFAGLPLILSVAADLLGGTDDRLGRPPLRAAMGPGGRGICLLRRGRRHCSCWRPWPTMPGWQRRSSPWARPPTFFSSDQPGELARISAAGMPAWSARR